MTERLAVLLSGEVSGYLDRTSTATAPVFRYADNYLRAGRVALSTQLPLVEGVHQAKKVKAFLAGLLPESEAVRRAWSDRFQIAPDDDFGLLSHMGRDCAGAVQFCPEDEVANVLARTNEFVRTSEAEIAARIADLAEGQPSWTMQHEHWSLGGQQEKFALAWLDAGWHSAHGSAATTHILKPGIRRLHHQALVEHATMVASATVGVDVATSAFMGFEGQWAIVIERFDRLRSGDRIIRIHQEDLAQACGRLPAQKYESRGGPGVADLARVVRRESTDPDADRRALADFLIINLVAGAPDGHAKNLSLIRMPGRVGLAPLYDLATGLAYDTDTVERQVALSIGGERIASRIGQRQWTKAARLIGLQPEAMINRVKALALPFPRAFESALAALPDSVPGVQEVAERAAPALMEHTTRLLERL